MLIWHLLIGQSMITLPPSLLSLWRDDTKTCLTVTAVSSSISVCVLLAALCVCCVVNWCRVCVCGASYMLSVFPDRYLGTTCFHMWCWIGTPPTGLNTRAPDPLWDSPFPHSLSPDLEPQGCLAPPLGRAWSAGEEGGGFLALSLGPWWRNQLASWCMDPFWFAL